MPKGGGTHRLRACCAVQVKPTHVLNAAGLTGRPNVDWCEDHKVGLHAFLKPKPPTWTGVRTTRWASMPFQTLSAFPNPPCLSYPLS